MLCLQTATSSRFATGFRAFCDHVFKREMLQQQVSPDLLSRRLSSSNSRKRLMSEACTPAYFDVYW
jgi:hypothetical protein